VIGAREQMIERLQNSRRLKSFAAQAR